MPFLYIFLLPSTSLTNSIKLSYYTKFFCQTECTESHCRVINIFIFLEFIYAVSDVTAVATLPLSDTPTTLDVC